MEKLKQKTEYVAKAQKTAKTVALLAAVIGVAVCVALFVVHVRFAVWDKVVVLSVSVLTVVLSVTALGVSAYYGNYAKYLAKASRDVVTDNLVFADNGAVVYKYGMRFDTFKFTSSDGNTVLLYAPNTDNLCLQEGRTYIVSHSGDFLCDISEVTDNE